MIYIELNDYYLLLYQTIIVLYIFSSSYKILALFFYDSYYL